VSEKSEPLCKPIEREVYDALLAAFRAVPGNVSAAAKAAGVARKTARLALLRGWPARRWPPIRDVLEQEQRLARAIRFQADGGGVQTPGGDTASVQTPGSMAALQASPQGLHPEAARKLALDAEAAALDAARARAQEGQMVQLSRGNTIALMGTTSHLLRAGVARAQALQKSLDAGDVLLTPAQTLQFVSSCGYLAKTAAEAAETTMRMERLLLGAPTEILGIQADRMSMDDAERVIDMASRALERVRAQEGLVRVEAYVVDPPPKGEPRKP
jgi:hypothetical protein